jgi:nucleotidyltransferase/DNA polymerase involved in DNA repair
VTRSVLYAEVPSFYATVEISQDPALAGRPVIVGGDPRKRGLVQAASREALEAGVVPEMPMLEALRLCPRARAVRTDMGLYRQVSRRLLACLRQVAGRVEPFGLGAAYLEAGAGGDAPEALAERLAARVRAELSLPLRIGIAGGKLVARLAAEEAGEGVRRVPPGEEAAFLRPLPVTRLEGVGRKTAAALAELGVQTVGDVVELGRERLEEAFGTHGLRIFALACAEDHAPLRAARHPQSMSRESTLAGEGRDRAVLADQLLDLARHLEAELARQALSAGRVALKLRYADHGVHTRSEVVNRPLRGAAEIQRSVLRLLDRTDAGSRPLRGLCIQLGKLAPAAEADRQLDLFPPDA